MLLAAAHARPVLQSAKHSAQSLSILAGLALVGLSGHATDWTFLHLHASGAAAVVDADLHEPTVPEKVVPTSATAPSPEIAATKDPLPLPRISFKSPSSVGKSDVHTALVEQRSLSLELAANGMVAYDPSCVAQLSTRVPGTVWRVEKQVGQPIRKGELLAIVEAVAVGEHKAEFLTALVSSRLRQKTLARLQKLGDAVAIRQVEEAEASLSEARIRLANAQHTLVNLGLHFDVRQAAGLDDDELVKVIQFLGLPDSIVQSLNPQTTSTNLLPLVAPFDGVVIGRDANVGEAVTTSQPQFVVADVSRMWIYLDVRKEDAPQLELGQLIRFTGDGIAGDVLGKLSWISTEVDTKTRTVRVKAEVDNPIVGNDSDPLTSTRLLRAQTFGTGRITVREHAEATVVPREAVHWDGERHVVFKQISDKDFEPLPVRPGVLSKGFVEIESGLQVGEVVAVGGSHLLKAELQRLRMTAGQ